MNKNEYFYQPLLDQYLAVSDAASDWYVRRCEYMMSGKPGKAKFVDEHILPDLRIKEKAALQKLIEILAKHYPTYQQHEEKS